MKLLNAYILKTATFFIVLFLIGCEKEVTNIPNKPRLFTSLVINNYHKEYGNQSWKENLIFDIYKSQNEFDNCLSLPYNIKGYSYYLPYRLHDSTLQNNGKLRCETVRFDSIKPGTYYLKIFNTENFERFVEFNKPHIITISEPLDSIFIFNTLTERYYINSFELKQMEINLNNIGIASNSDEKVSVKFWKYYPSGYAGPPPTVFFEDSVFIHNFPYKKSSLSISIDEFNSWWFDPYFFIEINGKSIYQKYEVNIFDLLNSNKVFSDSLVSYDLKQNINFKLYGGWNLK